MVGCSEIREIQIVLRNRVDPVGRNDVPRELRTLRRRARKLRRSAGGIPIGAALRQRIVDGNHVAVLVLEIREVAVVHRRRRHGSGEQHAFPVAVAFVVAEEEQLVLENRAADAAAELVLHERRTIHSRAVAEEGVGIQHLVAKVLVQTAVEVVGAALGGDVDHAAGKASELRAVAVGLHAELGNRIRTGDQGHDVAVAIVGRNAIKVGGALVGGAAANLVVAAGKHVLAGQAALGASLRNHAGSQRNQVQNVAAIERKPLDRARGYVLPHGGRFGLQHRSGTGDFHRLFHIAELHGHVDASHLLDFHLHLVRGVGLKSGSLDREPGRCRERDSQTGSLPVRPGLLRCGVHWLRYW